MEHNVIQKKIWLEEQQPVAWDKQRVWTSIRHERKVVVSVTLVRYAAAFIALMIGLSFYLREMNYSRDLELKITWLESMIHDHSMKNRMAGNEVVSEVSCVEVVALNENRKQKKDREPKRMVAPVVTNHHPTEIASVADSLETLTYVELPKETIEEPAVEAIVGFIPTATTQTYVKTKARRKVQFQFYRDSDIKTPPLITESKEFTARIK